MNIINDFLFLGSALAPPNQHIASPLTTGDLALFTATDIPKANNLYRLLVQTVSDRLLLPIPHHMAVMINGTSDRSDH